MNPAFVAAAFFVAVIINDAIQQNPPMDLAKHALFGFVTVLGLWALTQAGNAAIAWGLFMVPVLVFLGSFIYVIVTGAGSSKPFVPAPPAPAPSAVSEPAPVLNLPDESTVCVELDFSKPKPDPLPSCEVSSAGEIGMPGTLTPVRPSGSGSGASGSSGADAGAGSGSGAGAEDALGALNKRLTPYTVCDSA